MAKRLKSMSIIDFLGQYSADQDKVELYNHKKSAAFGTRCSMLVGRDGKPDSRYIGTGAILVDTSSYGKVLRSFTWKAYDGNSYTMLYCRNSSGTCYLVYVVNETWASIVAPTAANYYDDQDTPTVYGALPFMPPQTIPGFAVDLGGNLYVALGVSGVFRTEIRNGVLYFYLTSIPFTSFIEIDSARSFIAPMDLPDVGWSAIGDPERYTPLPEEIEAVPPTYGIDYHYQLGMLGGKGAQMVGCTVWGRAKVRWTEEDCYMIFGTGNDGQTQATRIGKDYGLAGFLSYNEWNDTLYWFSKYNGGSYLAATYGKAPEGSKVLDTIAIASDYAVAIYDAGYQIADVWQASGDMTTKVKKVSWGEWGEWNNIPATQRTALSIDNGTIKIDAESTEITTPTCGNSREGYVRWTHSTDFTSREGKGILASDFETDHGQALSVDGNDSTYMHFKYAQVDNVSPYDAVHKSRCVLTVNVRYDGKAKSVGTIPYNNGTLVDKDFSFNPVENATGVYLSWELRGSYQDTDNSARALLNFNYSFPAQTVGKISLKQIAWEAVDSYQSTGWLKLYGIKIYSSGAGNQTLITEAPTDTSRAVLTGLTANSQRDLGMFWARFVGTGNKYLDNLTISVRVGNTAPASIITGTASGVVSGQTLTDAGQTFTTSCEIGDYFTVAGVNYMITAVAAHVLTFVGTLAAGTYSYTVYGSASNASTWTDWHTLTERELKRGLPLRSLNNRAGTAFGIITSGKLYVQAMAVFGLDSQGISPELDYMVFTAITGDNHLSTFPAHHNDEHQFVSFKSSSGSTGNDIEAARSILGAWSSIDDKENTSYLTLADRTIMAFAGYAGAAQYGGRRAYYASGSVNAYRNILGQFTTPKIKGRLQGKGLAVGIDSYSMSDKINPGEKGSYVVDTNVTGVCLSGNYCLIASPDKLSILDISNPRNPVLISESDPDIGWGGDKVFVSGDYAYLTNYGSNVLTIYDISDINNPSWVSDFPIAGGPISIYVSGNYAYIGCNGDNVYIVDISDPVNPSTVTTYDPGSNKYVSDLCVSGDYLYLAAGNDGLVVVDISDPENPTTADSITYDGAADVIKISGDYAYVGVHKTAVNYALSIVDITDPTDITETGSETVVTGGVEEPIYGINIIGDQVFLFKKYISNFSITVFDVSDKTDPALYDVYTLGDGSAYKGATMAVTGDYLYLAYYPYGLSIYDINYYNALNISAVKNGTSNIRYFGKTTIDNLQILPKGLSFQGPRQMVASEIAVDVQSKSGFKLNSIEFTAEDTSYK